MHLAIGSYMKGEDYMTKKENLLRQVEVEMEHVNFYDMLNKLFHRSYDLRDELDKSDKEPDTVIEFSKELAVVHGKMEVVKDKINELAKELTDLKKEYEKMVEGE